MRTLLLIFLFAFSAFLGNSQEVSSKVSLIGENEAEYEQLMMECSAPLLYVSGNKMDDAYAIWTNMLAEMTKKAADQGLDIKGVKLWINLFWEADGSIKKIVYYPKPKSKNMDFDQLTTFFMTFAENYNLDIDYESCFSHHGAAAFPVKPIIITTPEDDELKNKRF